MTALLTLDSLKTTSDFFALAGEEMRVHKGRSVVRLSVDGKTHFLKRFWFVPSRLFRRHMARGFHEMRMIDWLSEHGFGAPRIVRRGYSGVYPFCTRLFFLMEEVPGELPLEAAWRQSGDEADVLLSDLATFAARLHDAGFTHTDFSERHILVGRGPSGWTFRLIDVERALVGRVTARRSASDLATLAASVIDETLRIRVTDDVLDDYVSKRKSLKAGVDFRAVFEKTTPRGWRCVDLTHQ